jgi:hypothetical protein
MLDISPSESLNRAARPGITGRIIRTDARQHGCERQGVDSKSRAQ